jgi:hypothetical protein
MSDEKEESSEDRNDLIKKEYEEIIHDVASKVEGPLSPLHN